MPYIPEVSRTSMDSRLTRLLDGPVTAGDLAYAVTKLTLHFVRMHSQKLTYATLAMAIGVLFLTTLEVVRRVVNPYEDTKRDENGEVF